MRVVFVDHTTVPGGAQLALARLLAAGAGWDATLAVPRGPLGVYADLADSGGVVRAGPALRPGAGSAGFLGQLHNTASILRVGVALAATREVRAADVLYANSARAAVYTTLVGLALRIPVVVHLRDAVSTEALGPAGYAAMRRLVLPRAAAVVANSQYTLKVAERCTRLPEIREVIHSPAGDLSSTEPPPPRAHVERVGMVARISPWKGQDLLIEAFARAFPAREVTLHLAGAPLFGETEHLDVLRQMATDLGIQERVVFHGHVQDVIGFIDGLDIAVQCSVQPEPLGQNVMQYLARGRPTVAAAEGGPAELVDGGVTGLLVPPRDAAALATALQALAEEPETRQSIGRAARILVARRSERQAANSTYDLCEHVVRRTRGREGV